MKITVGIFIEGNKHVRTLSIVILFKSSWAIISKTSWPSTRNTDKCSGGIAFSSIEELVNNPDVHHMIEQRIEGYQKDMASYEQIKRFVLLPRPFTMEAGELTNTLKIRRSVINKRYAPLIDAMYAADFRKKKKTND